MNQQSIIGNKSKDKAINPEPFKYKANKSPFLYI